MLRGKTEIRSTFNTEDQKKLVTTTQKILCHGIPAPKLKIQQKLIEV